MLSELERFQGCLIGLAVGDALGWPTEFLSIREIHQRFGPAGVTDFEVSRPHPPGTYTDDTQMSIAVAESLLEAGDRSLDELMAIMARRFVEWAVSPENNRAPGRTCMAGCRNLAKGVPWREAGVPDSKGCGSVMRVAPIGLYYGRDQPRLAEVARASSMLTHGHPTARAAAAAGALLVAWALRGDDPQEYPRRLVAAMQRMDGGDAVAALVARVPELLDADPQQVLIDGVLGEAFVGDEAVASALYCFCRSPRDFRTTVLTGANTEGDSDSIACIAGGISGAYNGLDCIPLKWQREVENADYLLDLGQRLYEARAAVAG